MMKIKINGNILKIIAIISMLIDHYASYFVSIVKPDIYYVMRSIGRLAMPIFLYLIVQGFFYTKNIKKYIFRIFCLATVTQVILLILGIINKVYFKNYHSRENEYLGVLFSYTLSLVLISMIEYKVIIPNLEKKFNFVLRIVISALIMCIYVLVDIEFDMRIPFMFVEIYTIEKILKDKDKNILFLKRSFESKCKYWLTKVIYVLLIELSFISSLDFSSYHPGYKYAIVYTAIPLLLYSGERGKNNKLIKRVFYAVFPIQHLAFYLGAMLICG